MIQKNVTHYSKFGQCFKNLFYNSNFNSRLITQKKNDYFKIHKPNTALCYLNIQEKLPAKSETKKKNTF